MRVYTSASIAFFASCMIGYDWAFISTALALPFLLDKFHNLLDTTEKSLIEIFLCMACTCSSSPS